MACPTPSFGGAGKGGPAGGRCTAVAAVAIACATTNAALHRRLPYRYTGNHRGQPTLIAPARNGSGNKGDPAGGSDVARCLFLRVDASAGVTGTGVDLCSNRPTGQHDREWRSAVSTSSDPGHTGGATRRRRASNRSARRCTCFVATATAVRCAATS